MPRHWAAASLSFEQTYRRLAHVPAGSSVNEAHSVTSRNCELSASAANFERVTGKHEVIDGSPAQNGSSPFKQQKAECKLALRHRSRK